MKTILSEFSQIMIKIKDCSSWQEYFKRENLYQKPTTQLLKEMPFRGKNHGMTISQST